MSLKEKLCIVLSFCSVLLFPQSEIQSQADIYIDTEKIPTDPKVKIGKLDNGLTYYLRNNEKPEDKLELRLVVNAGSILETERQLGLAHFMEHMCFNGTKNFEKNDLVAYLQSIGVKFGADLNAYTSFDETVYILPIPSDDPEKLEKGFQILEDWAHNTTLSEEGIDGERGVVLEELRYRLGADERMQKVYLPKMLHGSKYVDRLPIGTKENIENFTYQDLRDFYNTWYRPDLMAVVAVGDLDVATMEEKIKTHFSKIQKVENPKKREIYELPNHKETLIAIATDKEAMFSQVRILYKDAFNAPVSKTIADYREDLITYVFSELINNRLDELRNSSNPPFVFGFSYYGGTYARSKNAYQSFAQVSPDGQMKALRALLEENERVKRYGFQNGEFERAKKSILARMEKRFNDRDKMESGKIVDQYIENYLEQKPIPSVAWEFEMTKKLLPTIQLREMGELINKYLQDHNRVIVLTGLEKEGLNKVTEEEVRVLLEAVKNAAITPYEDNTVRSELIQNPPTAGSIVETKTNDKLGITRLTLGNGATVTYKKTGFKNDEVLFRAFSHGGSSLYTEEELMKTAFANQGLADAGIGGLSKNDLTKMNSGKIVDVRPSIGRFSENFKGSAAPKDLVTLFQMIHLYFTDLNKNDEAFQSYLTKQKSFLGTIMVNPRFYFQDKINQIKNEGNTRYTGFPTIEKLDASDYNLAYAKYHERFADAGDFHYYFVGNFDENLLKEFVKTYLASLPGMNSNETYIPVKFRIKDKHQKHVINRGSDPKSNVSISWVEEMPYDAKTELAVKALGEVLTIKLIEKLREEEGGVYGVGARGSLSKVSFSNMNFSISFPCGPENVDKLIDASLAEIQKIKDHGVSEKDMQKVKETYLVKRKEDVKTNKFWIDNLLKSDQEYRDTNKILAFEDAVNALTSDDLQLIAQKYLDANYFLGILMPEEE